MKRVYISFPYDEPLLDKMLLNEITNDLLRQGNILPISPIHLFYYLDMDNGIRKIISKTCYELIKICDEVYIYNYGKLSPGQQEDYYFCSELDKPMTIKNKEGI